MEQLNRIAEKIIGMVGHEYLYFDDALLVKISPHSHPVRLWAACVSPVGKVYVMDADEQWHEVHQQAIISSLYQRVQSISNYKKAV